MSTKKCVYCLKIISKSLANKTKDHILPRSWYGTEVPQEVQRLTVPSCIECNAQKQKSEESLFVRWGLGIDPSEKSAQGIYDAAFDRINIVEARDERVRGFRKRILFRLLKDSRQYRPHQTLKNFAPLENVRSSIAMKIPPEHLQNFGEKVVRALEYELRGRYVFHDRKVYVYYVYHEDEGMVPYYDKWAQLIEPTQQQFNLTPTFNVKFGSNEHNEDQVIYNVRIWNHVEFWGLIMETHQNVETHS